MSDTLDFVIRKGSTFSRTVRWEAPPYVYKAITAINQGAPLRVTVPGHGMPDDWRAAIVSVKGMIEINAVNTPPRAFEFHKGVVIDANTIEFNKLNSSSFTPYTSGGYIQFLTPVDLTGYTARMKIKDRVGGTVLVTLTEGAGLTTDAATKKIIITIPATDTAAYAWKRGVYDLEMVSPGGVVTSILSGNVTTDPEVTT